METNLNDNARRNEEYALAMQIIDSMDTRDQVAAASLRAILADWYSALAGAARAPADQEVLAVGARCEGDWSTTDPIAWRCRCGATDPTNCRTETAQPQKIVPLHVRSAFDATRPVLKERCGPDLAYNLRRCALLADARRIHECYAALLSVTLDAMLCRDDDLTTIGLGYADTRRVPEWLPVAVLNGSQIQAVLRSAMYRREPSSAPRKLTITMQSVTELGALELSANLK